MFARRRRSYHTDLFGHGLPYGSCFGGWWRVFQFLNRNIFVRFRNHGTGLSRQMSFRDRCFRKPFSSPIPKFRGAFFHTLLIPQPLSFKREPLFLFALSSPAFAPRR